MTRARKSSASSPPEWPHSAYFSNPSKTPKNRGFLCLWRFVSGPFLRIMKVYTIHQNTHENEGYVDTIRKSLLVRADFVLDEGRHGDPLTYRRWRRILADALPRLLGCADRSPKAERICLHRGEGEARFSGWVRIPNERRPSRRRLRKLKAKLRGRLEAGLLPIQGRILKVGVRRCRSGRVSLSGPSLFQAETAQSAWREEGLAQALHPSPGSSALASSPQEVLNMAAETNQPVRPSAPDKVQKASEDSFPASDPPAFTPTAALAPPVTPLPVSDPTEISPPVEVTEHVISDPAARSA